MDNFILFLVVFFVLGIFILNIYLFEPLWLKESGEFFHNNVKWCVQ